MMSASTIVWKYYYKKSIYLAETGQVNIDVDV